LFIVLHQATEARLWLAVGMALLIFVRHHENIRRLLTGVEPRLGGGKSRPGA
jgi:glycerol-3-phosphate acyltransferase PlsY